MESISGERRERVTFVRERFAELRQDFAYVNGAYRQGRLSLAEEITLLRDMMPEVHALIAEMALLTRPSALF